MHTGNRGLIKQINHSIALNLIKSRGPLSRTDIARLSGLTDRLLASGFIQEVGAGAPTGGRPRILLKLNPHAGFVVGLKLTERSIICALADLEANVLHDRLTPVQSMQDPQAAITA